MDDKLISADKIADYVCDKCGADICDRNPTYCVERDFIVDCAKEMPEAVVRCKDCDRVVMCVKSEGPDFFCAWGERREDETD